MRRSWSHPAARNPRISHCGGEWSGQGMMHPGNRPRGNRMVTRRRWGVRCWRAVGPAALLLSLVVPQVGPARAISVQAAAPVVVRPELSTYAGAPAVGTPTEVAQQPFGLAVLDRYTFVADPTNHLVRLLIDNTEVAFAGLGSLAVDGDGGNPAAAQLAGPYAVAIGQVTKVGYQVTGFDVYIADTFGHQVRKATVTIPTIDKPRTALAAVISTVAGAGSFGFSGDRGPATSAQLNSPYAVAWAPQPNVLYIADTLNNRVRVVDSRGTIRSLVASPLNHPRGLAVNGDALYIADTDNNVIRRLDLTRGGLTTVAGTGTPGYVDGVVATTARLQRPSGITLDGQDLLIADTGNNVVRELSAADNVIRTVAGTGRAGKLGDGGPAIGAQLSSPTGVAVRPDGDIVIADTGNNLVRVLQAAKAAGVAPTIDVEAGNGTASFAGDGKPPTQAQFAGPAAVLSLLAGASPNVAVPAIAGRRYIVDTFNQAVRAFSTTHTDPNNHTDDVSTVAGKGGVRGLPFANPMGSALSPQGDRLFVADTFNNVVRAIDLSSGTITTVAGRAGEAGYGGDGGAALNALLSYPTAVAVDQAGNLFVADTYNGRIREVVRGKIFTVAGTGRLGFSGEGGPATSADLYLPYGISVDGSTLYITDSFNHRIRKVTGNVITTVAGTGTQAFADGSAIAQAEFGRPWSTALDKTNLYVADYLNHRVRRVDLSAGTVSTVAGRSTPGLLGDVGPADAAEVDGPRGLSMLGDSGAMLIADSFNNRVRWLGLPQAAIQRTQINFDPTNLAGQSAPQSVTVTSTGNGLLVMGAVDLGDDRNNFYMDPAKNSCAKARLEPGISCSFDVAFQPRDAGDHAGTVVIPTDAVGGPQQVILKCEATSALVTLSPPGVVITQPANAPSTPAVVTLTNNGDGPLHIISIALDQLTSPDFSQSNNCPSVMAAHSSCQITSTLSQIGPLDKAARTGTLVVKDDAAGNVTGGGTSQSVPLTGSLAQAVASFNRQALTFTQNIGMASGAQTIILRNNGLAPLHLSGIHEDGDFAQTNNCPAVLAPGASCAISVIFEPSYLGERDGYIVVASDSVDSPQRIPVTGIATMALVQLTPARLSFSQNVGATAAQQTATLTNRGDGPLTIAGIVATGDFKAIPHCPPQLLPGQSCSIGVTFTPQAAGVRNGSLLVTNDANALPGSQEIMRLTGTGYRPEATLSATVLTPAANLGGSSVPQRVAVTNTGASPLTIRAIAIGGAAAGDFSQTNTCVRTIQPGASCAITVNFTPLGYGLRSATLTV